MKSYKWMTFLLLIALMLGACAGAAPTEDTTGAPDEPAGPFRVAVVMPSAINDLAFSQSMYDALLTVQERMGGEEKMEIVFSESMFVVDDAAAAIRDYASQGFDLVIAHGSQYGSSLQEIAPDFPETAFAWGTTLDTFEDQGITNVFAYEAASDQGGFVNGVLAATLSESGVIGVVGPIETGDAKLYVDGFVAGAQSVNPDIDVNVNWIGSFSDVALSAEAANTHISAGADVLTGTAQMVVGAVGVAEEAGALWFGTQADQSSLAPDIVVANQVYRWEVVLEDVIELVQSGTYGAKSYRINLANGGEEIVFNPGFDLPEDVKTLAEDTIAGIIDGSIVVGGSAAEAQTLPSFEETFRVAVVMPSAINDLAFSQSMYDALVTIQERMGGEEKMEIVFSESMFVVDDAAAAIRDYAASGYDLVIAHGSQYGSSLQEIAPDFPETSFAWGTTVDTFTDQGITNVFAYEAASDEGGYVNGVMAATLSESGVIGVVGPIETGDAKLYVDGFVAGVSSVDPRIDVNVNWIGSFSDVALAAEAANTHLSAGADVLTGTAQMVVGAIGAAEENGALWFGTQSDQSSLAPDIVVANQVYRWEVVLEEILTLISEGKYGGQAFVIDLANGGEEVAFNPGFDLPADVQALAEETIQGIIDGSITIDLGG
ncbi:MAG: BMP family protein [Anaerolineales bacterium]|nr:BMP family protein [Anaerolineales bacterium]